MAESKKKPTKAGFFARNQDELADLFCASRRSIGRMIEDGAPAKTPAGFDLKEWIKWKTEYDGRGEDVDYHEARRRRMAAQAAREEIRLGLERKRYMPTSEHEHVLDQVCSAFVHCIQGAPHRLATELANKTIPECKRIIQAWADRMQDEAFGPPEGENRESRSKVNKEAQGQQQ